MKNTILFFFLLLAAAVSAQSNSFVTDRLRAAEYFRIGTNTSQKVTGFDRVITAPGTHDSLPTSRAVVDFLEANFTPIGYYTAGTGISISDDVITNSAPDQVVGLTGAGITVITGTYPNFTITSNEVDGSTTNELQNLSLSGQSLSISSGTGVTLPVVGVSAGTGIGVSGSSGTFTVSNTGDLSATNELNTSFSVSGSNLALTDAGGTINVAVSSIAPVQAVSAGTGISISGTTTRTITNTGDLSATNEIQTLSLSGSDLSLSLGGGTVTLPGGTVSWPLLAPDGSSAAPSFAFENSEKSGIYYEANVFYLAAANDEGGGPTGVAISAGNSETAQGGDLNISSGSSQNRAGGTVNILSGSSVDQDAGSIIMYAGSSENGQGGAYILSGGAGGARGGGFELSAGSSSGGDGGDVNLTAGYGATPSQNGRVTFFGNGVKIPSATTSEILSFSTVEAGQIIFCTDATANDGSTGVMQVYNGSTWKNCW